MNTIARIREVWIRAGRSTTDYESRVSRPETLHDHELYLVGVAELTLRHEFLEVCKALLGESQFDAILSDLKRSQIEPAATVVTSPDGLFIFRVIEALGPSAAPKLPGRRHGRLLR